MTPQPLLIFRKDTRHLWPEILIVIALFVGFALTAPSSWSGSEYASYVTLISGLLHLLMPVAWLVVISRLIHDESLVGDRQFWTSRPYHWSKLLVAKLLFLAAYIYLPFLLMQMYLLKHAGLHPMLVLPALLHNLLLLTVIVIVPITAIAAVTSTFPRLLLSVLGAILYLLVLVAIVGYLIFLHMQVPHLDWILDAVFIVIPAAVLIFQYRTRRTELSRILLIATPLVAALIVLAVPTGALIAHAYPTLTDASAPTLASLADRYHPDTTGRLQTARGNVLIHLPFSVVGVDQDTDFILDGIRAHISGAGVDYTSPYLANPGAPVQINAGARATLLTFSLPLALFDKLRGTPVDLHLQLATQHLKAEKPSTWKATATPFSVPGHGICSFPPDSDPAAAPTCRYPLAQPEISFVTASVAPGSCAAGSQSIPARTSMGNERGLSLDFDPVITVPLSLHTGDPDPQHQYTLCPGADLTFIEATQLPKATLTADVKAITLDPYAIRIQANQLPPRQTQPAPQVPQ